MPGSLQQNNLLFSKFCFYLTSWHLLCSAENKKKTVRIVKTRLYKLFTGFTKNTDGWNDFDDHLFQQISSSHWSLDNKCLLFIFSVKFQFQLQKMFEICLIKLTLINDPLEKTGDVNHWFQTELLQRDGCKGRAVVQMESSCIGRQITSTCLLSGNAESSQASPILSCPFHLSPTWTA